MNKVILKSTDNPRKYSRVFRNKDRFDEETIWEDTEMDKSRKRTAKEKSYPLESLTSKAY